MSSPSSSPPPYPRRPTSSRLSTQHVPVTPSRLREATAMSPADLARSSSSGNSESHDLLPPPLLQPSSSRRTNAKAQDKSDEEEYPAHGNIIEPSQPQVDARTRLLESYNHSKVCGHNNCNHGTFSPRAPSIQSSIDSRNGFGGRYSGDIAEDGSPKSRLHGLLGDMFAEGFFTGRPGEGSTLSTTQWLANKHGITNHRFMYLSYYFPFVKWIRQYKWRYFQGDLVAALTMASFYIPMSLSYASNLAHIPPINGLYSFVFNPIIYAFLGTCPQMVVGPEAAGSLLVGTVVTTCIDRGDHSDDNDVLNAQVGGVVTGMAGAVIFVAGLSRLGFLDSVLSRPFLRGFISAIGFVILVDQAIPELGLSSVASHVQGVVHGSSAAKLVFLFRNLGNSDGLTAAVSITSFVIIMIFR
jgi:Sulfate permease family